MILLQVGDNHVLIEGRRIPAFSIQIDWTPGWVEDPDGNDARWYGSAFDLHWYDGSEWSVQETMSEDGFPQIVVTEWNSKEFGQRLDDPVFERPVDNWVKFLEMYDAKLNRR